MKCPKCLRCLQHVGPRQHTRRSSSCCFLVADRMTMNRSTMTVQFDNNATNKHKNRSLAGHHFYLLLATRFARQNLIVRLLCLCIVVFSSSDRLVVHGARNASVSRNHNYTHQSYVYLVRYWPQMTHLREDARCVICVFKYFFFLSAGNTNLFNENETLVSNFVYKSASKIGNVRIWTRNEWIALKFNSE